MMAFRIVVIKNLEFPRTFSIATCIIKHGLDFIRLHFLRRLVLYVLPFSHLVYYVGQFLKKSAHHVVCEVEK